MNVKLRVLSVGVLFFSGQILQAQKNKKDSTKTTTIEEVVVVAYGKQKRETIVGSNAEIKAKQFEDRAITNVAQALDGASPGVQVSTSTGQPGSAPSIRIRGIGSYTSSNAPLYIVDGVIYTGSLSALNPDDIASLNILKDAASTSLYGSGAANGVVLITTKKGRKGRDIITLTTSTGVASRSIPEYDRLDPAQYYPVVWEAIRNGQLAAGSSVAEANTYASKNLISGVLRNNVYNVPDEALVVDGVLNPNAQLRYSDLDWQKALMKTGFRQNYDLNYRGGNDKTSYFASLGYINESAYIINSDFERITGRLNVDSQLKHWLKVGVNIAGSNSFSNQAIDGATNNSAYVNPFRTTRMMGPIYNIYQHDPTTGQIMYDAQGNPLYDLGDNRGPDAGPGRHVILETLLNKNLNKEFNTNTRAYAEFTVNPYLTLTTNVGYDTRNRRIDTYRNKLVGDAAPGGAASRESLLQQTVTFNQLANYKRNFNEHHFDILVGHESLMFKHEYFFGRKQEQVADNNDDLINFVTPTSLTSYTRDFRREGFFSRVNYNYQEKYLLSASLRSDGSSRFNKSLRWDSFWSVGLGWRISQENFLKGSSVVDDLKLRTSYGQVGNDSNLDNTALSFYAYQTVFDLGYNNAALPGIYLGRVADPNIRWESNNQFDIALEYSLFKNRVSGSVEYYRRSTDGLIFEVPKPVSSGVPDQNIAQNVGMMYNEGFELALNFGIVRNENFRWDLNINMSTLKNRITRLPPGVSRIIPPSDGTKQIMEGRSIYDFWLRQWYGVDPSDGSALYWAEESSQASDSDIRMVNGAMVTTNFNKAKFDYSGTSIPDLFGSFAHNFSYKGLSLTTLFTYQIGGKTYDTNYSALMNSYAQGGALSTDILNRWTTPGQITDIPRVDASNFVNANAASDRWLVSSSFIALRQLTLGYTFSGSNLEAYGITSLKFFVNGENLWAKTARKGLEPVQTFSGRASNRFTPARVISLGFNISF